jgi:2-isopropylmalate synthase
MKSVVPAKKYKPLPPIDLPDRQWPSRVITQAPAWCSVDLRDGNQALAQPMSVAEKLEMFDLLVAVGFKEIEVGFPSASQIEFDFIRKLIEEKRIPDDVSIQVLVQAKEELIQRTVESLKGSRRAIIHLYNSTSPAQRRITFGLSKEEIVKIAVRGTRWIKERLPLLAGTEVTFQYSPESFSSTEPAFALEICEAVMAEWAPKPGEKVTLNLPATVEYATPNVHADQIEWMIRHFKNRDQITVSLHTHNDRGTGVAATELALLAGAQRVEGTLFGNGERTGNLDIVTVALNMVSQGVDPKLDFSNIAEIRRVYEKCTRMTVHDRHPYGGDLVFTAFSGSHQDAINKGLKDWAKPENDGHWEVPYLLIDPQDIGRTYEAIIRINSQSGKGGVAYIMEGEFGFQLPKAMHPEFGRVINVLADKLGREVTSAEIYAAFEKEYLGRTSPLEFKSMQTVMEETGTRATATVVVNGTEKTVEGRGNGPIDAFVHAVRGDTGAFEILSYSEHSLGRGAEARAVAYIEIKRDDGRSCFGAGIDTNIEKASIKALVSALNRSWPAA